MMAAGLAGVIEASPASNPDTLTAFATISNVISSAITVYLWDLYNHPAEQPDL